MSNHPLQNALSTAGAGLFGGTMANAAQGMISNASAQRQAYNNAVSSVGSFGPRYESKRMTLHVNIEQAGNGFIVGFANHYGELIDKRVATNIEQVQEIITSEMASRMLEESK
jgi:hypothetical protein